MRKILSLPILVATLLLAGCESADPTSSSSAPERIGETVTLAPRMVRTASISDSLYSATSVVRATVLDDNDQVIVMREAPFAQGRLDLPGVQASLEVKILIEGFNSSRVLLWSGTSSLRKAKDHQSAGVQASKDGTTGVPIYKRLIDLPGVDPTTDLDSLATANLVGRWATQLQYLTNLGDTVVTTAYLALNSDGTYALNQLEQFLGYSGAYTGLYEIGVWAVSEGLVGLVPAGMKTCVDNVNGYRCVVTQTGTPNGLNELYLNATPTAARFYTLDLYSDGFVVTDIYNSTNVQIWVQDQD